MAVIAGSLLVALTMMIVVIPSTSLWVGAGGILSRLLTGRASRFVNLGLALALAATVIYVWI
jgi:hypothetical protein